jgi:gag-polypeptide of LTR copia-type
LGPLLLFLFQPATFSHQLPIKLTHENSLLEISHPPYARGHDLIRFLNGSYPPPASTIPDVNESTIPNLSYMTWIRQDQLLLAWLLSSISELVVSQVVHCSTSVELWQELHLRYSSQSLVRVMNLKMQIHSLQKGHLSMQSYLNQKYSLADRLRLIRSLVTDADLQLFILCGLSIEYDSFSSNDTGSMLHQTVPQPVLTINRVIYAHVIYLLCSAGINQRNIYFPCLTTCYYSLSYQ